jgi:hypothetical protein
MSFCSRWQHLLLGSRTAEYQSIQPLAAILTYSGFAAAIWAGHAPVGASRPATASSTRRRQSRARGAAGAAQPPCHAREAMPPGGCARWSSPLPGALGWRLRRMPWPSASPAAMGRPPECRTTPPLSPGSPGVVHKQFQSSRHDCRDRTLAVSRGHAAKCRTQAQSRLQNEDMIPLSSSRATIKGTKYAGLEIDNCLKGKRLLIAVLKF